MTTDPQTRARDCIAECLTENCRGIFGAGRNYAKEAATGILESLAALDPPLVVSDVVVDPMHVSEARWLDERNVGADALARAILTDDGKGIMSPGTPCAELETAWRKLRADRDSASYDLFEATNRLEAATVAHSAMEAARDEVLDALRSLYDSQDGPPPIRYTAIWKSAMDEAKRVLDGHGK
ncbi:MAG: hypothetical protein Q7T05_07080 [Dehalococcoidia bacterium]|nr:hypothetical protein [Dehalococcoidia bacterium]